MKKLWFFIYVMVALFLCNAKVYATENLADGNTANESKFVYLSDVSYDQNKSFAGAGKGIHLDENQDNQMITLKVNGASTPFIKGVCAWAISEMVYDLSEYDYDYFTSYLGIDISEQSTYFNSGARFLIYTSDDCENWELKYTSDTLYGWSESQFAKVDIKGAKYLKLIAHDNGNGGQYWSNWYDETVYADAKLVKEDYVEDTSKLDFIKTTDEYNEIIKENYNNEITGDYELTLLQREFVNNVGYDVLQALAKYKSEYKETISWLMNDKETLKLYLVGGKPEGSYLNSIKVLTQLYTKYKSDLDNETVTKYGTKLGDLYRTMILALSLTESGNVYLWVDGSVPSDACTRYEIYKKLHAHEGQDEELIENKVVEALTVEEMRWVMNTVIDDEEILWLNDFVRNDKNGATSPYSYIQYTFDYNYDLDQYYTEENYSKWDEKYHLSKYNIKYEKGHPKLWVVFEQGAVCGGLSKTGSCIWGSYKGLPNTCVSQPAHCAYIYYTKDSNGNGIWNLGNDVSGWGKSGKTEHLNVRTMNDWGSGSYTTGWNANYILLGQAAQNEYSKYEKAEEEMMLANVYQDDSEKLEEIYRNTIAKEEINFDAWLGLVNLYDKDSTKTEKDYYNLAKEIAEIYKYYPNPMYDLINLIKPHLTSVEYETLFTLLETRTLTAAANATNDDSIQASAVRQVANNLLGNIDTTIAEFSFDGEDAGKIMLSNRYSENDIVWDYSLDGGETWTQTEEHSVQLTDEQIATITSDNDIKVHIIGVDYSDENIFTIDIKDSNGLPSKLYANDLENKFIGTVDTMEWKYSAEDEWTAFGIKEPDLVGNKTVIVRAGATGIYLAQNDDKEYEFTEENLPDTQKYVSIDHLSIDSVSSEQSGSGEYGKNVIDGNINTMWHTAYNGSDTDRTIVIKVDEPIYLSALQYVPRQTGTNGRTKNATLYASLDGEEWTEVASATNWNNNATAKMLELSDSVKAQYVKFVTTENWGDGRSFASALMINLFEDVTKKVQETTTQETSRETSSAVDTTDESVEPIESQTDVTVDSSEEVEVSQSTSYAPDVTDESTDNAVTKPVTSKDEITEPVSTKPTTDKTDTTEETKPNPTNAGNNTTDATKNDQVTKVDSTSEKVTEQPTTNDVPTSDDTSKEDTEVTTETDTTKATSTSVKGTTTKNQKISLKKSKVKKVVNKNNKKIKLTFKKIAKATNYQVKISKTKKFSKKKTVTKLVKKNAASINVKKLKKTKKYYIKVRAVKKTSTGKVYGRWSKVKVVKKK